MSVAGYLSTVADELAELDEELAAVVEVLDPGAGRARLALGRSALGRAVDELRAAVRDLVDDPPR